MAPMPSMNSPLAARDRAILLQVARQSIESGLHDSRPLEVELADYPEALHPLRATFVTLDIEHRLRGCIGTLEAHLPLVRDVADHAFAAAFQDPRFPPLRQEELPRLEIHISILSPSEPIQFGSEDELLAQLRPGVDGLILRLRGRSATFLPTVWESLPDPYTFLAQLKHKAGLPLDFWSEELKAERYTTETFGDRDMA